MHYKFQVVAVPWCIDCDSKLYEVCSGNFYICRHCGYSPEKHTYKMINTPQEALEEWITNQS